MNASSPKDIAVIVPARNEQERVGACLIALERQLADRARVIVVVNNTTDSTSDVVRQIGYQRQMDVEVIDCLLGPLEGVGSARRIGCDHVLHKMPDLRWLLTTDADCVVAPDWIRRNIAHLDRADVVCGKVVPMVNEVGILEGMDRTLAKNEGRYRQLVQDIYATYAAGMERLKNTHGEAAGASLAFSATSYRSVGGFQKVKCGEDRQIVRDFRLSGYSVLHADDVVVNASCRLSGRASGGMSDALMARVSGRDYLIDDCLPDAEWIVANFATHSLGVWPPHVPSKRRVHVLDLPRNIEMLENFSGFAQATGKDSATLSEAFLTNNSVHSPETVPAVLPDGGVLQIPPQRIDTNSGFK